MDTAQTTTTETPAPQTLRERIAADATPVASPAVSQTAGAVADSATVEAETPEKEAASVKPDADLSEAARTLRRNRADERKAKIQADIDALKREEYETRERVTRIRREADDLERQHATRGAQPRPATAGADPAGSTFRFPEYGDWASGQNDGQPYEAYLDARDDARDTWKSQQAHASQSRQASERARQEIGSKLDVQHAETRDKYGDFDLVIEPVLAQLRGTPRGMDLAQFLATSEAGGEIPYRLGKDPAALKVVMAAPNQPALMRALRDVELDILAPRKAPKPVTQAHTPPGQTVGGRASSATADDSQTRSTRDHFRARAAEDADRRARGVR